MSVTNLTGTTQVATTLNVIGGTGIGQNRNDLLKQILVAAANASGGGGGVAWGSITGPLSNQTDLVAALGAKQATSGVLALGGFSSVTGTLAVANGGTGITSFGAGVAAWLGTPTLANLNAAISDADVATTGANTFSGIQTLPVGSAAAPSLVWNDANTGIYGSGPNIYFVIDGIAKWHVDFNGTLQGIGSLQCSSNIIGTYFFARGGWFSMGASDDCISQRLAADHWVHARSTNAQKLSTANTLTSATNYEAVEMGWASNVAHLWTVKGSGGGTARELHLGYDSVANIKLGASGAIDLSGLITAAGIGLASTETVTIKVGGVDKKFMITG